MLPCCRTSFIAHWQMAGPWRPRGRPHRYAGAELAAFCVSDATCLS